MGLNYRSLFLHWIQNRVPDNFNEFVAFIQTSEKKNSNFSLWKLFVIEKYYIIFDFVPGKYD